jgi:hypothetical protein
MYHENSLMIDPAGSKHVADTEINVNTVMLVYLFGICCGE